MEISIQEVFNKVIDSGLYYEAVQHACGMCQAVYSAREGAVITSEEYFAAKYAIDEYMREVGRPYGYLVAALRGESTTWEDFLPMYEETRDLYLNWANRPMALPLAKYKENQA